ncbi:MAG: alpha/beta fold hydrolase [Ignavibacteriales bacterium]|nr:alpha/beta fold hydrolase [Ignavibacteriales bacterium]
MKRLVSLIVVCILIPLFIQQALSQESKVFSVKQLYGSNEFAGKTLSGVKWIEGGKKFSYQESDAATRVTNIWTYNVADGKREMIVDAKSLVLNAGDPPFRFTTYQWSPDERQILFVSAPPERQYLSRLTPAGNLFLYELSTKAFRRLTNTDVPQYNQKFSPDGKKLGFVRSNNIYILDLSTGQETQLTSDGMEHIINGRFDWVYEEELGISDGWQWSPDGKMIAYWQLDENRVPEFHLMDFMTMRADVTTMRYPKAGDPNSTVKIGVLNVETKKTVWMDLGTNDDIYIARIHWTNKPNMLAMQRLNRAQNKIELLMGDITTGKTNVMFTDEEKTWIEVQDDFKFLKGSEQFLWSSEKDGFRHLYLYDVNGKLVRQLTKGAWDVDGITRVDEKNKLIYFTAYEKTPLERHFYSIRFDGKDMKRITPGDYTYGANLAPDNKNFIATYSNVNTPPKIALYTTGGKQVRMIEENNVNALKEYKMGMREFFKFKTTDGIDLNGSMIKPVDFNLQKKYPVLIYVYGGPGSQTVSNSWGGTRYLWHQLLAQKGYVVVSVDGRGTGQRGKAFKSITYKNLGKWEVNDQIEAAKYLGAQSYVDKTRIGIWGWSYGGYMASLTILQGADYFKTAVAVAPVTSWKFYDSIYTERYMLRPQDNEEGYKESASITHAAKLKGNLLVVHGTTDDNVHWQNSVQFIDALQKADKHFQTMFYANKNHGIRGGNTSTNLFEMITDYILEKL